MKEMQSGWKKLCNPRAEALPTQTQTPPIPLRFHSLITFGVMGKFDRGARQGKDASEGEKLTERG
jgi:hypothetical protein